MATSSRAWMPSSGEHQREVATSGEANLAAKEALENALANALDETRYVEVGSLRLAQTRSKAGKAEAKSARR